MDFSHSKYENAFQYIQTVRLKSGSYRFLRRRVCTIRPENSVPFRLPSEVAQTRIPVQANISVNSSVNKRSAFLLVDHGSKRDAANDMLIELRDLIVARLGQETIVHIAHMELATPTILDGFRNCIADGVNHVVVVPFFLAPGRHCTTDIPALAKEAAESFPGCTYEVRPHLGTHPKLVDAVIDRAVGAPISTN